MGPAEYNDEAFALVFGWVQCLIYLVLHIQHVLDLYFINLCYP